ncbi:MAG: hypothetical protein KAJ73_00675 [Zetaproteobacteria bacterium]|nr:hypothetical protein [Zetaproteobacteria bacterium]
MKTEVIEAPTCPYCRKPAELKNSAIVYGKSYGMIWICMPCRAWVGVHKNSKNFAPLGRLADRELRYWKKKTHAAFDPLWARKQLKDNCSRTEARKAGYKWLAGELSIPVSDCHIGHFDVPLCQSAIQLCREITHGKKAHQRR